MIPEITNIVYNVAQLIFILCTQKIKILEWGRGTGKSTILGRHICDCVVQMPRSSGVLVAETYAQILTRTLPSTIAGLEQHGLIKDLHFFVGKRPPKSWNWPNPYEPPLDYKRCIIFWNGTVLNFVSQDGSSTSGRGMNNDWVVGDEAVRLNKEKFDTEVVLTLRGNKTRIAHYPDSSWKYFGDCPLFHTIVLASSTPTTAAGRWFLEFEEEALLHPDKVAFIRASAEVNRANLEDDYFENARKILPDFLYDAEVLNKRMTRIDDGFYPSLDEAIHTYNKYNYNYYTDELSGTPTCKGDDDVDPDQALIAGIDWGSRINCMVTFQNLSDVELRVLKSIYVLYPQIIDDLIDKWADYYEPHKNKTLYLYYDPTGNNRVANSRRTFAEQARDRLTKRGWTVILMTGSNHNVLHQDKYKLCIDVFKNEDKKYPDVRFNKANTQELWISMTNAPAKIGRNEEIKKDKKSESSKTTDQQHATHFSDAFDVVLVGMYLERMLRSNTFIPNIFK